MATENDKGEAKPEGAPLPETVSKDEIRTIVAGVVKTHLTKALGDALGPAIKAALDTELAPIRSEIAQRPKPAETGQETPKKPEGEPVVDPKTTALEQKWEAKFAKLEKAAKDADERAARERARALETKASSDLRHALAGKVHPDAIDDVATLLRARNRVIVDDEGNVSLRVKLATARGVSEEEAELPLTEALPHFLRSKEAALYLPPPTAGAGSAKRPAGAGAGELQPRLPAATPVTPVERVEARFGAIRDLL